LASGSATEVLAGIIVNDPDRVLNDLAESLAALVGVSVSIEPVATDPSSLAPIFGDKQVCLFRIEDQQGAAIPACVALDLPGAVGTGGALIMMTPDAIAETLTTQKIPDTLHDSIGEVAKTIVSTLGQVIGKQSGNTPELRRAEIRQIEAGTWPGLLQDLDKSAQWLMVAGKIKFAEEEKGTILIATSGASPAEAKAGAETVESAAVRPRAPSGAPTGAIPAGLKVQVAGFPADSSAVSLRETLEALGVVVLPMHAGLSTQQPEVIFVVSRSHTDLKLRLGAINASGRRPAVVIACSDRPTREIVWTSRKNSADHFLVLPADLDRLRALLEGVLLPA
jgi:hypothetical protein